MIASPPRLTHPRDINRLRSARFERPDAIPMVFHINGACWKHYPDGALEELMAAHTDLFPDFDPAAFTPPTHFGGNASAAGRYTDPWGCVWETTMDGIVGTVVEHPLASWDRLAEYRTPAPGEALDWDALGARHNELAAAGRLRCGGLPHGHTFLRACDIRGYENVVCDLAAEDPRLVALLERIETHNRGLVERYLAAGIDWMGYPEDLGMQVGPMVTPASFRRFINPIYQRLIAPAREAGCIIHMHSDGDIRTLASDLIDGGVQVLNLQDQVNGLAWIHDALKGKVCIDLDLDRQHITRFGTPADIDRHLHTAVEMLAAPEGGLMCIYGLYPGVPLENVEALMDAMDRYADAHRK